MKKIVNLTYKNETIQNIGRLEFFKNIISINGYKDIDLHDVLQNIINDDNDTETYECIFEKDYPNLKLLFNKNSSCKGYLKLDGQVIQLN